MKTLTDEKIINLIGQAIADSYDAQIDEVLSVKLDSDGIFSGQVVSDGQVFDYAANEELIEIAHNDSETNSLNGRAMGYLDALGIRCDSDSAYSYMMGSFRLDAQIKCRSGGTPCGRRCLPRGQKCRKNMGGAGVAQARRGMGDRRNVAIGAGVGAAAIGAGFGAAALMANRNKKNRREIQSATRRMEEVISPKKGGNAGKYAAGAAAAAGVAGSAYAANQATKNRGKQNPQESEPQSQDESQSSTKKEEEFDKKKWKYEYTKSKYAEEERQRERNRQTDEDIRKRKESESSKKSQSSEEPKSQEPAKQKSGSVDAWEKLNSKDVKVSSKAAYDELGLTGKESPEEIKKAYKKLAREHHPDLNNNSDEAKDKFQRINEAYGKLKKDSIDLLSLAYEIIQKNHSRVNKNWWNDFSGDTRMYEPENAYLQPLALHR